MQQVIYKKRYVDDGEGRGSSRGSQYKNIHRNWCDNALMSRNETFSGDDLLSIFSSCSLGFPAENRSLVYGECSSSAQECSSSAQSNRRAVSGNSDRRNEETAVKGLFDPTPELSADNADGEDPVLQQRIQGVFSACENLICGQASVNRSAISTNGSRRNEETTVKGLFDPTPEFSPDNADGEDPVLQQRIQSVCRAYENLRSGQASVNRSRNGSRRNEETAVKGFPELSAGNPNGVDHDLQQLIQDVLRASGNATGSQNQNCRQSTSFNSGRLSSKDRKKFTLLEQNLNAIIRNFKKCQESCLRFLLVYDEWSKSRRGTITQLIEIAEDLGIFKSNCNFATVTGHSAGTAGTIIFAGTAFVATATSPVGVALAAVGVAVGVAGGLTCLGTSIARSKVQSEKIKKAQDIYEKDKEKFLVMTEWFKHCCTYQEAVNELMDFDVFQNILTDTKNFISYFLPEGCKSGKNRGRNLTIMAVRFVFSILKGCGIEVSFVMSILTNPNLREILKELFRLHQENLVVFEGIAMTSKIFSFVSVAKGFDMVDDIATTVATKTAASAGRAVGSTVGKVTVQGICLCISFAIDFAGLVLTSIDIHKGSKCPGAKRIFEAVEKLADEYYHLRKVYRALQKYKRNTMSVRVLQGIGGRPVM